MEKALSPREFAVRAIKKAEDENGPLIVTGVVYSPGQIDTDGDAVKAEEILIAAYAFIASGRINQIDIYHNELPTGSKVVASWVADEDGPHWSAGSWLMSVAIFDPAIKRDILSGKLSGFSFQGDALSHKEPVYYFHPITSKGTTELSQETAARPAHDHDVELRYDKAGKVIPTRTGERLGHSHPVTALGRTELEEGHGHRLILAHRAMKSQDVTVKSVIVDGVDVDPPHLYRNDSTRVPGSGWMASTCDGYAWEESAHS